MLWYSIQKQHIHNKINECIKKALYKCIIHNPQVVRSPIDNDCLKLSMYGKVVPQLVTRLLLQVSVRVLNNSMVITPEEGGVKEAREAEDNTTTVYSNLT